MGLATPDRVVPGGHTTQSKYPENAEVHRNGSMRQQAMACHVGNRPPLFP
jgi:hypothetical protein